MKSYTKLDFFKVSGDLVGVITNCARGLFWKGNFNPRSVRAYSKWPIKEAMVLPQNSPIKLNLAQPRPYPGCQTFFSCCWQRKLSGEAAIGWRRTDINLFTGVIETMLTKFAIPQFDNISRRFYTSLPHVQTCEITKTNRSHKKPVWPAILFQNRMEVQFVTAVTRGFFSRSSPDPGFAAQSSLPTTGKKALWHPGLTPTQNHPKNQIVNRPFAQWHHFTTTTRILFVFPFTYKFGNPNEV